MLLVFLDPYGRLMDPKYVNDLLHEALNQAKLPKTGMHSLRHSATTFMLMASLNLHQVSRYLDHSQNRTHFKPLWPCAGRCNEGRG